MYESEGLFGGPLLSMLSTDMDTGMDAGGDLNELLVFLCLFTAAMDSLLAIMVAPGVFTLVSCTDGMSDCLVDFVDLDETEIDPLDLLIVINFSFTLVYQFPSMQS